MMMDPITLTEAERPPTLAEGKGSGPPSPTAQVPAEVVITPGADKPEAIGQRGDPTDRMAGRGDSFRCGRLSLWVYRE